MATDGSGKKATIKEVAERWVHRLNFYPYSMIEALVNLDMDSWHEITMPRVNSRVNLDSFPDVDAEGNDYDSDSDTGTIVKIGEDGSALVQLDNDAETVVKAAMSDLEVERYEFLPMWGTMWSFDDNCDNYWLSDMGGLRVMSDCGFRVYEHDEWGFFFGIDGAGYDFYEAYWIPLYKKYNPHWRDEISNKKVENVDL